jgi:hypothetical protein
MTAEADWQRLCERVASALRELPLRRDGFEARTKRSLGDWAFLGALPRPGERDLETVIEQRAGEIANLIVRLREAGSRLKPCQADTDLLNRFQRFSEAWHALPAGARPRLDWGRVKVDQYMAWPVFVVRAFRAWARQDAKAATKQEIADLLAEVFFELTGSRGSGHSVQSTPFIRFVQIVFDLGGLGDAKHTAKHAVDRFIPPEAS